MPGFLQFERNDPNAPGFCKMVRRPLSLTARGYRAAASVSIDQVSQVTARVRYRANKSTLGVALAIAPIT